MNFEKNKIDSGMMTYDQMKANTPKEVDSNDVIDRPPSHFDWKQDKIACLMHDLQYDQ